MSERPGNSQANQMAPVDFERFLNHSVDLVCVLDVGGYIDWMNPQWGRRLGWSDEQLRACPIGDYLHQEDMRNSLTAFYKVSDAAENIRDFSCRIRTAGGEYLWVRWNLHSLPRGRVGVIGRDMSKRVATEQKLAGRKRFLEMAARIAKMGYWRYELDSQKLIWSDTTFEILGLKPGEFTVTPHSVSELYHEADRNRVNTLVADTVHSTDPVGYKVRIRHGDGSYRHIFNRIVAQRDSSGKPVALFGASLDITDYEHMLQEIGHSALHDPLTGLANRTKFNDRLDEALARSHYSKRQVAVVLLDLDQFKEVNDTLGHPIGDQLLIAFAQRFRKQVRETEILARLGGDEFGIIQLVDRQVSETEGLCNRILKLLQEPFDIEGHVISIGASIGVAIAPEDGTDAPTLLRNADIALYRSKNEGRNTYRFFETGMDARLRARRQLETDLKLAISEQQFELHYQPVFSTQTGELCSLEALIRWNSPTRGRVLPGDFLALAEQTGLMVPIGQWVMRQACQDARLWPDHIRVAINVSAVEFQDDNLIESVTGAVQAAGIHPGRLELEITESALLADGKKTLTMLHKLRELGVMVVMDDFGMGYSSLSYLRSFPFDKLKLDGAFVRDAATNPGDRAIVRAVSGMARSLGMQTTAEGIETEFHRSVIANEGYTEVQGFLYSKPRPAREILQAFFSRESNQART